MSDGQDIKSITSGGGNPLLTQYILWLDTFLRNELLAKGEKTKPTQPYGSLQSYWDTANNMARAGSWGMGLPFINEFLSDYKTYQSAFPEQKPTAKSYAIIPDPSGYDVLVGYSEEDNKGDIVSYDIVGRTQTGEVTGRTEGITPYQQRQNELQWAELEERRKEAQAQLEQNRAQQLAELAQHPENWISYWILQYTPIPQIPAIPRPSETEGEKYYGEIGNFPLAKPWETLTPAERGAYLAVAQERGKLPGNAPAFGPELAEQVAAGYIEGRVPGTNQLVAELPRDYAMYPETGLPPGPYPTEMQGPNAWATYYNTFGSTSEAPQPQPVFQPRVTATLGAPSWLPQFVEGLTAGQPILQMYESAPGQVAPQVLAALPVKIPSGQMWAALPYTEQQGLAGYANWASKYGSQTWADIQAQMEAMRPVTPYGAAYPTWRAARQWA